MHIDPKVLSEANYTGTRLIEITDEQVIKLNEERKLRLKEGEPVLQEMEKLSPPLDEWYKKLQPVEQERAKIKEAMQPDYDAYNAEVEKMEKIYQKAQVVNNKMQPLIRELVAPHLGEFEEAKQLVERDGKLFVEVIDVIEEKVKSVREAKAKK